MDTSLHACSRLFGKVLVPFALAGATSALHAQIVVSQWTFEAPNVPADVANTAVYPEPIPPATGTGVAGGLHGSTATDYTTPSGNGSSESFNSNNWGIGDYYQFSTSTTGAQDIGVQFDQTRSGTGPGTFDLSYSTDGTNFILALDDYTVPGIGWDPAIPDAAGTTTFFADLSSVAALDDANMVVFRLVAQVAGGSAVGTSRVDNFTVLANVPEPGGGAYLGAISLTVLGVRRLRRGI